MCGIVSLVNMSESIGIEQLTSVLAHRGPDDEGFFVDREHNVSLGMRRLSIVDLEEGQQPMCNEDGLIWIIQNGEIYNSPELRTSLETRGHVFSSDHSDTEVILHLYEEEGVIGLQSLNGMFSFVIYDQKRQILFGARDRLGIKPLYFWKQGNQFACASELKALLLLPSVERKINLQSLYHYFTLLYVPGKESIFQNIERIPPGHYFKLDLLTNQLEIREYWRPRFNPIVGLSEAEWAARLREKLGQAVKRWTLSDVPIACSLSGGLDSTAVAGLMTENSQEPIQTFSLGFRGTGDEYWDETDRARAVAKRLETNHHEIRLEPEELLDDLVAMVWHLDEPYGGGLPSWYIFREMARFVKVGLTGTGGDELFGNYGKFAVYESSKLIQIAHQLHFRTPEAARQLARIAQPLTKLTGHLPSDWPFIGKGRGLARYPKLQKHPFGYYYYANWQYFSDEQKLSQLLVENIESSFESTSEYLQAQYDQAWEPNIRDGLAAVDFRNQLAEEFLFMTDRFSMAHSLEARVPLLDHELVEFVCQIPPGIRTKIGDLKYLYKLAVSDLLPAELLDAPKRGFVIPVERWLRGRLKPLTEHLLARDRLIKQGIFRSSFYDSIVQPHLSGQANNTWQIWSMLMFQIWHVVFIEENSQNLPTFSLGDLA